VTTNFNITKVKSNSLEGLSSQQGHQIIILFYFRWNLNHYIIVLFTYLKNNSLIFIFFTIEVIITILDKFYN